MTLIRRFLITLLICQQAFTTFGFSSHVSRSISTHAKQESSALSLAPRLAIRGGSSSLGLNILQDIPKFLSASPDNLFNGLFAALFSSAALWKVIESSKGSDKGKIDEKPAGPPHQTIPPPPILSLLVSPPLYTHRLSTTSLPLSLSPVHISLSPSLPYLSPSLCLYVSSAHLYTYKFTPSKTFLVIRPFQPFLPSSQE